MIFSSAKIVKVFDVQNIFRTKTFDKENDFMRLLFSASNDFAALNDVDLSKYNKHNTYNLLKNSNLYLLYLLFSF